MNSCKFERVPFGLEPLLKKRDRFKDSSAQCIAERFILELHLDEADLNGAVRHVWMNVLHAGEPGKIRTAIPTGYEVSMK